MKEAGQIGDRINVIDRLRIIILLRIQLSGGQSRIQRTKLCRKSIRLRFTLSVDLIQAGKQPQIKLPYGAAAFVRSQPVRFGQWKGQSLYIQDVFLHIFQVRSIRSCKKRLDSIGSCQLHADVQKLLHIRRSLYPRQISFHGRAIAVCIPCSRIRGAQIDRSQLVFHAVLIQLIQIRGITGNQRLQLRVNLILNLLKLPRAGCICRDRHLRNVLRIHGFIKILPRFQRIRLRSRSLYGSKEHADGKGRRHKKGHPFSFHFLFLLRFFFSCFCFAYFIISCEEQAHKRCPPLFVAFCQNLHRLNQKHSLPKGRKEQIHDDNRNHSTQYRRCHRNRAFRGFYYPENTRAALSSHRG